MTQYSKKSYKLASDNTKHNTDGKAVILENDEWHDEKEWDEVFEQMQKERKILSSKSVPFITILLLTGSNKLLNSILACHNLQFQSV